MRTVLSFVLAASALAVACGGKSDDDEPQCLREFGCFDSPIAVAPGDPCETYGITAPSTDGCNTCTCSGKAWSCSKIACNSGCKPGDPGCDDPPPQGCPPARAQDPGVACTEVEVYVRSPDSGLCCHYGDPCSAPEGWAVFSTEKECQGTSSVCTPGETMNDGCNSCTCTEDGWACTDVACPETCKPGQTRRAIDGCNTCTCGDDGQWGGCSEIACDPNTTIACGGFAGDTCTDDEYCAYVEGEYCGDADASSTCQKRPEACDDVLESVCGCDNVPYENACSANMAGTGVRSRSMCAGG
jgi:hypothetical protein